MCHKNFNKIILNEDECVTKQDNSLTSSHAEITVKHSPQRMYHDHHHHQIDSNQENIIHNIIGHIFIISSICT